MKILDIAFKDLLRSFRNGLALSLMFLAPLLLTGAIYFAFGGLWSSGGRLSVPATRVQVVNLDRPPQSSSIAFGQMLLEFLHSPDLAQALQVTDAPDGATAREAVRARKADVALIIPENFTAAVLVPEGKAVVTLVQDPTLTLGPGIVQAIVSQFVDSVTGAKIAANVIVEQARTQGTELDAEALQNAVGQYVQWAEALGASRSEDPHPAFNVQAPPRAKEDPNTAKAKLAALTMSGMLIFFVFFTGASTAESIITEHEEGTLARLFTTPTPRTTILSGKLISVFLTVIVQTVVLLLLSRFIFGVHWGEPLSLAMLTLGLIAAASGFGILIMSFVQNTRQTGAVMGGVLTITGMLGGLFVTHIPTLPPLYEKITLLTPHGWALRGLKLVLAGGGPGEVLLPAVVLLGMGAVFFTVGALAFRRRFA